MSPAVSAAHFWPAPSGHSPFWVLIIDSQPRCATAQGPLPREPAEPHQATGPEAGEGGRLERKRRRPRLLCRRGGAARFSGPLPHFYRPPVDSFPPARTPGLPSWRQVLSPCPSRPPRRGPNLSFSIRGPRGPRLRAGSADGFPAPLLPGLGAAPPPSAAAMLTPGDRGGGPRSALRLVAPSHLGDS